MHLIPAWFSLGAFLTLNYNFARVHKYKQCYCCAERSISEGKVKDFKPRGFWFDFFALSTGSAVSSMHGLENRRLPVQSTALSFSV